VYAPEAVRVADLPMHTVASGETISESDAFTVMLMLDAPVHPPFTPVTE
jgi:hypothetical protein